MLLARSGVPGAAGVPQRSASATSALPLYSPTRHCVASSWSIQGGPFGQHSATTCRSALRPDETAEQALERRLRESETVEQRVSDVYTQEDLQRALDAAGDKLVVLEIQSEKLCQTGFDDEPELHWQLDKKAEELARLAKCLSVKHVFARTARECPDVQFLSIQADSDGACTLCDTLGVDVLPTLQFYRNGRKLWEHRGVTAAEQDLGEGVLFYGNAAGKGVRGSDFVTELRSKDELTVSGVRKGVCYEPAPERADGGQRGAGVCSALHTHLPRRPGAGQELCGPRLVCPPAGRLRLSGHHGGCNAAAAARLQRGGGAHLPLLQERQGGGTPRGQQSWRPHRPDPAAAVLGRHCTAPAAPRQRQSAREDTLPRATGQGVSLVTWRVADGCHTHEQGLC